MRPLPLQAAAVRLRNSARLASPSSRSLTARHIAITWPVSARTCTSKFQLGPKTKAALDAGCLFLCLEITCVTGSCAWANYSRHNSLALFLGQPGDWRRVHSHNRLLSLSRPKISSSLLIRHRLGLPHLRLALRRPCRCRPDHLHESLSVRLEQLGNAFLADLRDDDLPNLDVHIREYPHALHLLRLDLIVLGRRDVVHRASLVAVDQEQVHERHQSLFAERREGVLVANREDVAAATILDVGEDDVGELFPAGLGQYRQLQKLRTCGVRTQLDANLRRVVPVLPPRREPLLQ